MNRNIIFGIIGGVLLLGLIFRKDVKDAGTAVAGFVANPNKGTDFEDTGVIGTLGNVANTASGGLLARFGSFLGGKAADVREAFTDQSLDG